MKKKYTKIKHQRDEYQKELEKYREKDHLENLLKKFVTTRETYVQTEPSRSWGQQGVYIQSRTKEDKISDADKTNKLLSMHNQLMRRYEKEVKNNLTHIETITELKLKISDYENKLHEERDKVARLEKDIYNDQMRRSRVTSAKQKDKQRDRSQSPPNNQVHSTKYVDGIRKEREKLRKENKKLKEELKGLDFGFFEEIEDIKFALQQSAKLNKEYEKTIKKLCMKFGVPCPDFEKFIGGQT